MNIFGFRPFKGRFNLGNSDDIPTNTDGTLIGAVKKITSNLTANNKDFVFAYQNGQYGYKAGSTGTFNPFSGAISIIDHGGFNSNGSKNITISKKCTAYLVQCNTTGYAYGTLSLSGSALISDTYEISNDPNYTFAGRWLCGLYVRKVNLQAGTLTLTYSYESHDANGTFYALVA